MSETQCFIRLCDTCSFLTRSTCSFQWRTIDYVEFNPLLPMMVASYFLTKQPWKWSIGALNISKLWTDWLDALFFFQMFSRGGWSTGNKLKNFPGLSVKLI